MCRLRRKKRVLVWEKRRPFSENWKDLSLLSSEDFIEYYRFTTCFCQLFSRSDYEWHLILWGSYPGDWKILFLLCRLRNLLFWGCRHFFPQYPFSIYEEHLHCKPQGKYIHIFRLTHVLSRGPGWQFKGEPGKPATSWVMESKLLDGKSPSTTAVRYFRPEQSPWDIKMCNYNLAGKKPVTNITHAMTTLYAGKMQDIFITKWDIWFWSVLKDWKVLSYLVKY